MALISGASKNDGATSTCATETVGVESRKEGGAKDVAKEGSVGGAAGAAASGGAAGVAAGLISDDGKGCLALETDREADSKRDEEVGLGEARDEPEVEANGGIAAPKAGIIGAAASFDLPLFKNDGTFNCGVFIIVLLRGAASPPIFASLGGLTAPLERPRTEDAIALWVEMV